MSREEHNKAGYIIFLISEFADKYGIHPNQAYQYLKRHKGLEHIYSVEEALDTLYNSETFDRLQDSATGFYYQSVGYVASFLQNEVERAVFC